MCVCCSVSEVDPFEKLAQIVRALGRAATRTPIIRLGTCSDTTTRPRQVSGYRCGVSHLSRSAVGRFMSLLDTATYLDMTPSFSKLASNPATHTRALRAPLRPNQQHDRAPTVTLDRLVVPPTLLAVSKSAVGLHASA